MFFKRLGFVLKKIFVRKFVIRNISSADDEFLEVFYQEVQGLDEKLIDLILSKEISLIVANKLSDVFENKSEIQSQYGYAIDNLDKTSRGLFSDNLKVICIFSQVVAKENIGAILYHEIGHLIDISENGETPSLSIKESFCSAYKEDFKRNKDRMEADTRYRLKHFVQDSISEKVSESALRETFAHIFGVLNGKSDDENVIEDYFPSSIAAAKDIYNSFLNQERLSSTSST